MVSLWHNAIAQIRPKLGHQTYELWLRPVRCVGVEGDGLQLTAPSMFVKEWFSAHYLEVVLSAIFEQTGQRYRASLEVVPEQSSQPEQLGQEATEQEASAASVVHTRSMVALEQESPLAPRSASGEEKRSHYDFSNFVRGPSNDLAAAAAVAVAEAPGMRFNPLVIHGGVGLGKTHLLHAIAQRARELKPGLRVVYCPAERFMNDYIEGVRHHRLAEFRSRFRDRCDLLLLDDLQCLAGRERTMDELFHVFNALHEAGKQMVFAGDRAPKAMTGLDDRLVSRLSWGLVVDVAVPDVEMRQRIFLGLGKRRQIPLSQELAEALALGVAGNVRELEGVFTRLVALAELQNRPVDKSLVERVLGSMPACVETKNTSAALTMDRILHEVSQYFRVKPSDLRGQQRSQRIAKPRMVAMYLARELTGASLPAIGMSIGGKDHTTVLHACKRIAALQRVEPELDIALTMLRTQLSQTVAV